MYKIYTWVKKELVEPFYWNTDINEISIFIDCDYKTIKEMILKEDPSALSIRFGVDETGKVYFWNGSINHTGICNALNKFWILTGIYKFDDDIYTSNNQYSQKQINKYSKDLDFQTAFKELRTFNPNIKEIKMSKATLKF